MTKIRPGVYWVGAIDWDLRRCGAYTTPRGTTYNSYLVRGGESNALIDTVKDGFADELLYRLEKHIEPSDVDFLVVNHAERDHAGDLKRVAEAVDAPIVCRDETRKTVEEHGLDGYDFQVVEDGDTLDLGDRTLRVMEARMLHWPDSTFTYLEEEKVLFPNDAFGQHVATTERWADLVGDLMWHAKRYYAAIVQPFSPLVQKKLKELEDVELEVVAPAHGVIWRRSEGAEGDGPVLEDILEAYDGWSRYESSRKATVVYDSMWDSTAKMARALAQGLMDGGVEVEVFKLRESDDNDIVSHLLESEAMFVGSPTLNGGIYPSVGEFLTFLTGLKPELDAVTFGSYGWAPAAERRLGDRLESAGLDVVEGPTFKYVPDEVDLDEVRRFARDFAINEMED